MNHLVATTLIKDMATTNFKDIVLGRITKLINNYIDDQWEYQNTNIKEKLKEMKSSFTKIKSLLDVAERKEIDKEDESLLEWLSELKNTIYDAEYVMDIFEYKRIKDEVENYPESKDVLMKDKGSSSNNNNNNKVRYYSKVLSGCCFKIQENASVIAKRLVFADEELNDLLQVVTKLNNLAKEKDQISSILNSYHDDAVDKLRDAAAAVRVSNPRETTSAPAEPKLFGRYSVKQRLTKLLQNSNGSSETTKFDVVSVVGVGGVGKTTLVQYVFNIPMVKKCFNVRAWVCVSNNFSIKSLTVRIVESAEIRKPDDFHTLHGLEAIQKVLISGLESKKFLIVLDDVWEDMEEKWEQICSPFYVGKKGSIILVTSRSRKVAKVIGAQDNMQIELDPLDPKVFLDFFEKCAFGNKKPENYPAILKNIAEKISKKLGGLPLAAKTVGGVLSRNLNIDHWKSVLDNEGWKKQKNGSVMSALKLSYDYLPKHLKKCFVYCCLFPKDYRYDAHTLADVWITLSCVSPADKNKRLVDIQREYILDLVNRCFLQKHFGGSYVMHDLLHDLAQQIVGHEVYRVEDDESFSKEIPEPHCIRHLYVKSTKYNTLKSVLQNLNIAPTQLRSLLYVVVNVKSVEGEIELLKETIAKLKGLRFLFLNYEKQMKLWENIGDLLHLRCFSFCSYSSANTFVFPISFWKLHQLEILRLKFDGNVKECVGLHKLINLRCFEQHGHQYYDPEMITSYLSRLKSLEAVPGKFIVDGKEMNHIGQLGDLDKIGGELTLHVRIKLSNEEARKANLKRKKYLTKLTVNENCADEDGGMEDDTLVVLQPHEDLQNLIIEGCKSITKAPDWLSNLSNLTILQLLNLLNLHGLPPNFGYILSTLEELYLGSLPLVTHIDIVGATINNRQSAEVIVFPSLVRIKMHDMINLEGWSLHSCSQTTKLFPKISKIEIRNCPKLLIKGSAPDCYVFPFQTPSYYIRLILNRHVVEEIKNWRNMVEMWIDNQSLSPVIDYNNQPKTSPSLIKEIIICELPVNNMMINLFPSLDLLQIVGCDSLESLGQGVGLHCPNSIKILIITRCSKLKFMLADNNGLQTFSSLHTLIIRDCWNLQSMASSTSDDIDELVLFPPSLNKLILDDCPKLKLPAATIQMLNSSSSIHTLLIGNCGEIDKSACQHGGIRNRLRVEEGNDLQRLNGISRGEVTLDMHVKLSSTDAIKADLNRIWQLSKVIIKENEVGAIESQAMEALQPSEYLKKLKIEGCKVINRTPTWLPLIFYLTQLELCNLPNLQGIPSHLGYYLLKLKKLHLISLPSIKKIHVDNRQALKLFPSLVDVKMSKMINFEGWSLNSYSNQTAQKFSKLSTIEIYDCPKLLRKCDSSDCIVFPLPSTYCNIRLMLYPDEHEDEDEKEKGIIEMKIDAESLAPIANDNNNSKSSTLFNCIKEIGIVRIHYLMEMMTVLQVLLHKVSCLEGLIIEDCNELDSLDNIVHHHLQAASHISKLVIRFCSNLKFVSAANIFPSLETLIIEDCMEIEFLTDDDDQLLTTNIKKLTIKGCPRLNILFLRPHPSIETLIIEYCREIERLTDDDDQLLLFLPSIKKIITRGCGRLKLPPDTLQKLIASIDILIIEDWESLHPTEEQNEMGKSYHTNQVQIIEANTGWIEAKVIEDFKPHENIEKLKISMCKHITMPPKWLCHLSNLTSLLLFDLPKLQRFPPYLGIDLKSLKYLHLISLPSLNHIHLHASTLNGPLEEVFPSLTYLKMHNMINFKGWSLMCIPDQNKFIYFPKLYKIDIHICPMLLRDGNSLLPLPSSNRKIRLTLYPDDDLRCDDDDEVNVEDIWMIDINIHIDRQSLVPVTNYYNYTKTNMLLNLVKEMINKSKTQHFMDMIKLSPTLPQMFSSLELLIIEYCDDFESLDNIAIPTASFNKLIFRSCDKMRFLSASNNSNNLRIFSSPETLIIEECNELQSLTARNNIDGDENTVLLASVKTLEIRKCPKLMFLSLQLLPSLKDLIVEDCEELQSLTNQYVDDNTNNELSLFPTSIARLIIKGCNKLKLPAATLKMLSSIVEVKIEELRH